jgi:hypothetical protein
MEARVLHVFVGGGVVVDGVDNDVIVVAVAVSVSVDPHQQALVVGVASSAICSSNKNALD